MISNLNQSSSTGFVRGGFIDACASHDPEISCRQSAITVISAPYHRYISIKTQATSPQSLICNSMLVSLLLFNAHTCCICLNHNRLGEIADSRVSMEAAFLRRLCIPVPMAKFAACLTNIFCRSLEWLMQIGNSGIAGFSSSKD